MAWREIIDFFKLIGLTPKQIVPLILLTLVLYIVFSKKLYNHLNPIKHAIIEIQSIFRTNEMPIAHSLTETRGSPLKPTKYGIELFRDSGLKKIFDTNKKIFLQELTNISKKKKYWWC